jgi:hypothetical protein
LAATYRGPEWAERVQTQRRSPPGGGGRALGVAHLRGGAGYFISETGRYPSLSLNGIRTPHQIYGNGNSYSHSMGNRTPCCKLAGGFCFSSFRRKRGSSGSFGSFFVCRRASVHTYGHTPRSYYPVVQKVIHIEVRHKRMSLIVLCYIPICHKRMSTHSTNG